MQNITGAFVVQAVPMRISLCFSLHDGVEFIKVHKPQLLQLTDAAQHLFGRVIEVHEQILRTAKALQNVHDTAKVGHAHHNAAVPFLHSRLIKVGDTAVVGIIIVKFKVQLFNGNILAGRLKPHGFGGSARRTAQKSSKHTRTEALRVEHGKGFPVPAVRIGCLIKGIDKIPGIDARIPRGRKPERKRICLCFATVSDGQNGDDGTVKLPCPPFSIGLSQSFVLPLIKMDRHTMLSLSIECLHYSIHLASCI